MGVNVIVLGSPLFRETVKFCANPLLCSRLPLLREGESTMERFLEGFGFWGRGFRDQGLLFLSSRPHTLP